MAGLLNAQQVPEDQAPEAQENEQQGMNDDPQDPILKQVEDGIESSVPANLKKQYMAVVVAGMKVMFDKNTSQFMGQRLQQSGDIVEAVSTGIADLLVIIYNESKRTMSIPAAMLAAITLMCQALDYAEKAGKTQVTKEMVAQCTQATTQAAMEKFGISKDKVNQAIAAKQGQQGAMPQDAQQQTPMGA